MGLLGGGRYREIKWGIFVIVSTIKKKKEFLHISRISSFLEINK